MSQDVAERRVRSGAKSCAECRRRKVRCIYSFNNAGSRSSSRVPCDNCSSHGRTCLPQIQRPQASNDGRMTARERIGRLERNMNSLVELMNEKHAAPPSQEPSAPEDRVDTTIDDFNGDFDTFDTRDAALPSHLRLLFDDFIDEPTMARGHARGDSRSAELLKAIEQKARAKLQPLLPSHEEVLRISSHAGEWMDLYYTLFPPSFAYSTAYQLINNYGQISRGEASPVTLAMYLLSLAITAQQVPSTSTPTGFFGGRGVGRYADVVCRTVEQVIISNNALASTADALETAMLCVRLSLGRGNLKGTWLVHRRIIALAEVIGLPQVSDESLRASQKGANSEDLEKRANVWEAICATDRNFSLMLGFPPVTARYRFPRNESIIRDGVVSPNAYNYRLSNICAAVFEIDDSYLRGASPSECYEKVLSADRQIRALGSEAPKAWWKDSGDEPLANLLVKFWHHYFLARIHLRPGLVSDSDEHYPYSRSTCQDACRNAVQRFTYFGHRVPTGFFVCRVLDVQVFTAATFLLLSSRSQKATAIFGDSQASIDSETAGLLRQVVDCFASVRDTPGSDLACEAEVALSSLLAFVQGDHPGSQPLRLQIPLLGRIQISKATLSTADEPNSSGLETNPSPPGQSARGVNNVASGLDSAFDPILWSFEFSDPSMWMGSADQLDLSAMDSWLSGDSVGYVNS